MRTIRMFTTYAADDGKTAGPGDTLTLEDHRAADLVGAGYAEHADNGTRQPPGRRSGKSAAKTAGKTGGKTAEKTDAAPDAEVTTEQDGK